MGAIDNKVAIVTGGGGGIGGAIVERFAREGATLAVADIDAQAVRRCDGQSNAGSMGAYRYSGQCRRRRRPKASSRHERGGLGPYRRYEFEVDISVLASRAAHDAQTEIR